MNDTTLNNYNHSMSDSSNNYITPNNQQPSASTAGQNANNQQSAANQAKAVTALFNDVNAAQQAVNQLRASGFTTEEINIVAKGNKDSHNTEYVDDSIVDGTMAGGAIGGIGGMLLGAGALMIPGLGPVMAAGPIAATISGAIGGGITGGLIDWGIPAAKSEQYNNEVSSGKTLAVIKTPATKVSQAVQVLTNCGAMNVETHNLQQ